MLESLIKILEDALDTNLSKFVRRHTFSEEVVSASATGGTEGKSRCSAGVTSQDHPCSKRAGTAVSPVLSRLACVNAMALSSWESMASGMLRFLPCCSLPVLFCRPLLASEERFQAFSVFSHISGTFPSLLPLGQPLLLLAGGNRSKLKKRLVHRRLSEFEVTLFCRVSAGAEEAPVRALVHILDLSMVSSARPPRCFTSRTEFPIVHPTWDLPLLPVAVNLCPLSRF